MTPNDLWVRLWSERNRWQGYSDTLRDVDRVARGESFLGPLVQNLMQWYAAQAEQET